MVELKGSEKQVKWANEIREKFIQYVNVFEKDAKEGKDIEQIEKN